MHRRRAWHQDLEPVPAPGECFRSHRAALNLAGERLREPLVLPRRGH